MDERWALSRRQFLRTLAASGADAAASKQILDLNPHLADAYEQRMPTVSAELRGLSLADPRGITCEPPTSSES